MRSALVWIALVGCGAVAGITAADGPQAVPPEYRVDEVDGRLTRRAPPPTERLRAGDELGAGTVVRTGWWSSARLSAPAADTSFELGARTTARLARDRPGLLLVVEHGRVRGLFGPQDGGDDRVVETPSAVLAVRGTEYGVAVDGSGATRVVVFEGEVEVRGRGDDRAPVRVRAGEHTMVSPGRPPAPPGRHGMGSGDWDHGRMPRGHAGPDGHHPDRGHGMPPGTGHGPPDGGAGGPASPHGGSA